MVTTLYLIRHGETEGGEEKQYKGHMDVPLSEKGVRQIKRVSEYICQNTGLKAVYTSDLSRAIRSAEIIAEPHSLKPIVAPSLRERNFGLWEGMSFDEIREKYPEEFEAWAGNPLKFSPIGGESTLEVRDRVIKALDKIIRDHRSKVIQDAGYKMRKTKNHTSPHIAVVSHGGVNRIILCHILGIPLENLFRIEQDYGALNIIEFWDKYPVVKLINYVV